MNSQKTPSNDARRVEEPRPPTPEQSDAPHKERTQAPFVDPYEMRAEPQPEEPGYGHGV